MPKLTEKSVAALGCPPGRKDRLVFDDAVPGLAVRVAAGGSVIAQDEATSVVWGMPGAAANAGICSAILPLNQIAPKLVRLFAGDRA